MKGRQGEEEEDLVAEAGRAGVLKVRCGVGPDLWATAGALHFFLLSV